MSSSVLKIGSEDITKDIVIPDSFVTPKSENANVVNLPSAPAINNAKEKELENKIKELEAQKNQIISEMNVSVIQKNAKVHDELRKGMQFLINETKKIAPLEKTIKELMAKPAPESSANLSATDPAIQKEIQELGFQVKRSVEVLKKEIQVLAETAPANEPSKDNGAQKEIQELTNLVKKSIDSLKNDLHSSLDNIRQDLSTPARQPVQLSYTVPESHTREVEALSSVVRECTTLLNRDFDRVTSDLRPLLREKAELLEYITSLKGEFASKENQLARFESDKRNLEEIIFSLKSEKTELEAKHLEQRDKVNKATFQITHLEEVERNLKDRVANLEAMDKKHIQVKSEMMALVEETEALNLKKLQVEQSIHRMEQNLKSLGEQYHSFEQENLKVKMKIEALRTQEMNLVRSCADHETKLSQFKSDIENAKTNRSYTIELQEEAQKYFEDRRGYYLNEISQLDDKYHKLSAQLEAEVIRRKEALEREFKVYSDEKDIQFKAHLDSIHQEHMVELTKKQAEFMERVLELSKKQFERTAFATAEQKTADLKVEVEELFQQFFNIPNPSKKNWKIF